MTSPEGFGWLAAQIAEVRTNRFFVVDGCMTTTDSSAEGSSIDVCFPDSYRRFVREFGSARLYRLADGYELGVLAEPCRNDLSNGETVWYFGYYGGHRAFFMDSLLGSGKDPPVYEASRRGPMSTGLGFQNWLKKRSTQIRRRIGKHRWEEIVRGPTPFSEHERQIVDARRLFRWRIEGISGDGSVLFRVRNDSNLTIPYLSIGIRARDGSLVGGVWLPISDISPGTEATIAKACYRERIAPDAIVAFDLPDPEPEDRERYWEFKLGRE